MSWDDKTQQLDSWSGECGDGHILVMRESGSWRWRVSITSPASRAASGSASSLREAMTEAELTVKFLSSLSGGR